MSEAHESNVPLSNGVRTLNCLFSRFLWAECSLLAWLGPGFKLVMWCRVAHYRAQAHMQQHQVQARMQHRGQRHRMRRGHAASAKNMRACPLKNGRKPTKNHISTGQPRAVNTQPSRASAMYMCACMELELFLGLTSASAHTPPSCLCCRKTQPTRQSALRRFALLWGFLGRSF